VSISMTVLKAFSDMREIGARKFPAAPAHSKTIKFNDEDPVQLTLTADNEIDAAQLINRSVDSFLQSSWLPDISLDGQAFSTSGF